MNRYARLLRFAFAEYQGSAVSVHDRLKILIADDQEYFRSWLKQLLCSNFPEIETILETASVEDSIGLACQSSPDLVLLDIEFRDQPLHGMAAAEKIWQAKPNTTIMICSAHKEEVYIKKLAKIVPAEATYGYVLKDQSVQRFVYATRSMLADESWIDPEVYKIFRRPSNKKVDLTDSEYETIVLIALGLGDRACADLLYLGEKAVQARLSRVYSKLGLPAKGGSDSGMLNNRCRAVWVALRRGLIDEVDLRQHEIEVSKLTQSRGLSINVSQTS
jgi:DNA-binding NarL/FixJ family response regulator